MITKVLAILPCLASEAQHLNGAGIVLGVAPQPALATSGHVILKAAASHRSASDFHPTSASSGLSKTTTPCLDTLTFHRKQGLFPVSPSVMPFRLQLEVEGRHLIM